MFGVLHMDASGDEDPPIESLSALYDELWSSGIMDGNVAVIHDSGWCISAHRDGRVTFEHLSEGGERHMRPIPKLRVLELWQRLIDGDITHLLHEPWIFGYVESEPRNT